MMQQARPISIEPKKLCFNNRQPQLWATKMWRWLISTVLAAEKVAWCAKTSGFLPCWKSRFN